MTNDYTAHEIHRLDQAYPDAVNNLDDLTGNPARKARLAEVGPEVFAAELTRDLANSAANPMSLAAWAAVATVRLMVAGKSWEDDTEAAWAKVEQLTAERDEYAGALTEARTYAAGRAAEVGRLVAENARVRQQRDELKPVVEAAKAWRWSGDTAGDHREAIAALNAAVDALPKAEVAS
ncbi:hypothetical protein GAR05_06117 [Micromonospora saelicesensis]|uniref:Uncharacterized protein n=1 Tax=Micromonospora saelicesensis TaxID=285676 RepID=A0ABX9CAX2_9ACTN|nr:hypothetical protein [Micromonospora saelicesensis]RAN92625.1 hypothetical protein GAR05_06117 [Micromonospora saelicesensis]